MIERKLSKVQGRTFIALASQKAELQKAFQEITQAEREQIEMLRKHFELPEGDYQIRQEQNGELTMVFVEPAPASPDPTPATPSGTGAGAPRKEGNGALEDPDVPQLEKEAQLEKKSERPKDKEVIDEQK